MIRKSIICGIFTVTLSLYTAVSSAHVAYCNAVSKQRADRTDIESVILHTAHSGGCDIGTNCILSDGHGEFSVAWSKRCKLPNNAISVPGSTFYCCGYSCYPL